MGSSAVQGELWGRAARDWAQFNEPSCEPFYEAVFDSIGLSDGQSLLDAGCGSGHALQLAAKRGAKVSGLDASSELLQVIRERVADGAIEQGDLEEIPFPDNSFDAVTAFNSVQYAADPVAALRECRRVAKPGAPVAILTLGRCGGLRNSGHPRGHRRPAPSTTTGSGRTFRPQPAGALPCVSGLYEAGGS